MTATAGPRKRTPTTRVIGILVLSVYVVSFFLPAFRGPNRFIGPHDDSSDSSDRTIPGYVAFAASAFSLGSLAQGMRPLGGGGDGLGVLGSLTSLIWLANPILWLGLFLLARRRVHAAGIVGIAAAVFALAIARNGLGPDEHLLIGFHVWVISMAMLTVALITPDHREKRRQAAYLVGLAAVFAALWKARSPSTPEADHTESG